MELVFAIATLGGGTMCLLNARQTWAIRRVWSFGRTKTVAWACCGVLLYSLLAAVIATMIV